MRGAPPRVLVLRVPLEFDDWRLEGQREGVVPAVVREEHADARGVQHHRLAILRLVEVVHLGAGLAGRGDAADRAALLRRRQLKSGSDRHFILHRSVFF